MGSELRRRALTALAAIAFVGGESGAQAQPILLRIRPNPGDTLRMRLDQQLVMTGTTRMGKQDSTRSVTTTTFVRARVVVERSDPGWTTVLAITDSVDVTHRSGAAAPYADPEAPGLLQGKRLRLQISPEGVMKVAENPDGLPEQLQILFGQLPATLPKEAVAVGQRWTQDVPLPLSEASGEGTVLRTSMRLDSLSREGRIAYISLNGTFTRDSTRTDDLPPGASLRSTGRLRGTMRIDRMRGWLTESSATITVNSLLTPPPGSPDKPMKFYMKLTQQIRAIDKP